MNFYKVVKLLIGVCLFLIILGLEKAWGYKPRLPSSLLHKREIERNNATGSSLTIEFVKPGDRVVGGKPAVHGEFPFIASLQKISFFGTKTHYCGATVISERCILTAAHCVDGRDPSSVLVRMGSNTLRIDPLAVEANIDKFICHPDYDSNTILNDIAIIKLKKKVAYKINIKPMPLPPFKSEIPVDTQCIIAGWGALSEGSSISKTLMYADVPVISDNSCRNHYGKSEIFETMMCAGYTEGAIDSCQGDSGGPMICNGNLAGVVSWGIGCARPRYPGVYTQVSYYTKWIESQTSCFEDVEDPVPPPKNPGFSFFNFW